MFTVRTKRRKGLELQSNPILPHWTVLLAQRRVLRANFRCTHRPSPHTRSGHGPHALSQAYPTRWSSRTRTGLTQRLLPIDLCPALTTAINSESHTAWIRCSRRTKSAPVCPPEPQFLARQFSQSSDRPSQRTRITSLIGDAPRKFRKSGESTLLFANW